MLVIDIIAVVPGLLEGPFSHSILNRAAEKQLLKIRVFDLRAFGIGQHRQIDDYAFGGGAGMVLMAQPLADAIRHLQNENDYDDIIYLTPDGETLNQPIANQLSLKSKLLLICGHYKGIDERIRQKFVTREISIGDYVLSGGELAAAVLVDAIGRLIPGVLNDGTSALLDSFQDDLLAPPVYTRPADWEGMKVPDILMSGHEAKIDEWRYQQSLDRTTERRPDLLKDE
ncbi:MAG TPA: tRNA (guanosine(37)-N1)-methyltransferase TrmD [Saprospiraceae bacterium]|nr:tRNA (guanosine(37)-N1)-methyltransferase TrmD [Saprospiraceae bacterium]